MFVFISKLAVYIGRSLLFGVFLLDGKAPDLV